MNTKNSLLGVVMGSKSDWMIMEHCIKTLDKLGSINYEVKIISAHRTPDLLFWYASTAEQNGLEIIIAGAGGSAHLPGMLASKTLLPVIGVPIQTEFLGGLDSLLSIGQMPGGIPVATMPIGKAGAINAALFAVSILANKYPDYKKLLENFRIKQTQDVLDNQDPRI